ncbi:conserved phage C-terminal domain-containing protein [Denitrobacterium detoxificans]|uniref:Phage conserved hypothetical protein C-terminal domain-containing protein n=1 Tax=Denitrobacterium detoxificans TaxID=79604 RepID=A0A1H8UEJ7_9ACTN|nr:conserved phage C-terminal domain-containing protein [Denitrobacterium detoxificans]SEO81588.1 phage conserved hypothetical protein, C-terminal domain-containing protein [Denitrobacterium detoxificans]SEP01591.1 phage conserved hypothetical protein, C-terminal domain-containing protein [Denitrobacterium detoxificans]
MLPDNAYMVIQSFMRDELHLAKTELLVYAVIHGFSQGGDGRFVGTNEFLSEWTGASERSVKAAVGSLCGKGLVEKGQAIIDGKSVRTLKAMGVQKLHPVQKLPLEGAEIAPTPCKNCTPYISKKDIEKDREKDNPPICPPSGESGKERDAATIAAVTDAVDHLNEKTGKAFRPTTASTVRHVSARLRESYTVDDLNAVTDLKCSEWLGDPRMAQYLRPETLFGPKFEGYLQQARASSGKARAYSRFRLRGEGGGNG